MISQSGAAAGASIAGIRWRLFGAFAALVLLILVSAAVAIVENSAIVRRVDQMASQSTNALRVSAVVEGLETMWRGALRYRYAHEEAGARDFLEAKDKTVDVLEAMVANGGAEDSSRITSAIAQITTVADSFSGLVRATRKATAATQAFEASGEALERAVRELNAALQGSDDAGLRTMIDEMEAAIVPLRPRAAVDIESASTVRAFRDAVARTETLLAGLRGALPPGDARPLAAVGALDAHVATFETLLPAATDSATVYQQEIATPIQALHKTVELLRASARRAYASTKGETDADMVLASQVEEAAVALAVLLGALVAYVMGQKLQTLARQSHHTRMFLDTVLEHLPITIFVKRARDRRFVLVNRAAETLVGMSRDDILGKTAHDILPPDAADAVLVRDSEALARLGEVTHGNVLLSTTNQGDRATFVTRLAIPGLDGQPEYLIVMMEDITDRQQAVQRVDFMANYDALTELPNRTLFNQRLAEAVAAAERGGEPVVVMGLDLDHFKEINDTLGHAAGDTLLRAVAGRLRLCVRGEDMVARFGADEFAVILAGLRTAADAEVVAERFIAAIREPFEIDGQRVFVGLSVGIAFGAPGIDPAELLKQADTALYASKAEGRGAFRYFAPGMDAQVQARRGLENDLRAAIGTDQFTLHYQPQIDLESDAIIGAEALMRWNRPGHGNVPPNVFIPQVEQLGLIGELGAWLLHEACTEAMRWPEHVGIAVNVSPVQFRLPGFLAAVSAALERSGLAPSRLELEVTEGILLQDTQETLAMLAQLRERGLKLALDDFGTGYSSLSYLQKFSFDKLKIDRCFVKGLRTDPNTSAIVRAVVGLSEALGMRTIAEGIEDEYEVALLRAHGCKEAQGYHFFRPMTAAALHAVLAERAAASVPTAA